MSELREFHYRLPHRIGGWRPGSHRGSSQGGAQEFVSHLRLYDRPDPRRLDLRASLRNIQRDWLVRVNRQRASIPVHAIIDVSASMSFSSGRGKLAVAAEFVEALGQSAFRVGDSLGMLAFDSQERADLFVPARIGRGIGDTMANLLRECSRALGALDHTHAGGLPASRRWRLRGFPPLRFGHSGVPAIQGLQAAIQHLGGRRGLVFIVSDFHWPLEGMGTVLDSLAHSFVVPLVIWDPAEIEPPLGNGLMQLRDIETGAPQTLWMRPRMRSRWRESVDARRRALDRLFAEHAMVPFYVTGSFDSEALSRYFLERAL